MFRWKAVMAQTLLALYMAALVVPNPIVLIRSRRLLILAATDARQEDQVLQR